MYCQNIDKRRLQVVLGLTILAVVVAAYVPSLRADFIWDDDNVILCYVDPSPGIDTASIGYQFRVAQKGSLAVTAKRYRQESRNGEWVEAQVINDEKLVCAECAYIIEDVLT